MVAVEGQVLALLQATRRFCITTRTGGNVNNLLRKARGIIGMGVMWGVVWAAIGALIGVAVAVVSPEQVDGGETPIFIARILGTAGFLSGAGFALMLSLLERGRTVLDVSLVRVALWGVVGGALIPLLTQVHNSQLFWTCPLGAAIATGTVVMARRTERRERIAQEARASLAP